MTINTPLGLLTLVSRSKACNRVGCKTNETEWAWFSRLLGAVSILTLIAKGRRVISLEQHVHYWDGEKARLEAKSICM